MEICAFLTRSRRRVFMAPPCRRPRYYLCAVNMSGMIQVLSNDLVLNFVSHEFPHEDELMRLSSVTVISFEFKFFFLKARV